MRAAALLEKAKVFKGVRRKAVRIPAELRSSSNGVYIHFPLFKGIVLSDDTKQLRLFHLTRAQIGERGIQQHLRDRFKANCSKKHPVKANFLGVLNFRFFAETHPMCLPVEALCKRPHADTSKSHSNNCSS